MGIQQMRYVGPPLSASDVEAVGDKLSTRLPRDYKSFLLRHNGGKPEPACIVNAVVAVFYSINAKEKVHDLLANVRRMRRYLPDGVICIASDTFGNEICLAIRGKNRGKVYFWDHEGASEKIDPRVEFPWLDLGDDYEFKGDDWPGHPDLGLIADSFAEFLDSFHDFDDDEAQAKPAKATPKPSKAKPATKQPGKKPRKSPKA